MILLCDRTAENTLHFELARIIQKAVIHYKCGNLDDRSNMIVRLRLSYQYSAHVNIMQTYCLKTMASVFRKRIWIKFLIRFTPPSWAKEDLALA
ncbi:hypothetical protein AAKU64_004498 [Undibacterium sp. GrIS 1.8]